MLTSSRDSNFERSNLGLKENKADSVNLVSNGLFFFTYIPFEFQDGVCRLEPREMERNDKKQEKMISLR